MTALSEYNLCESLKRREPICIEPTNPPIRVDFLVENYPVLSKECVDVVDNYWQPWCSLDDDILIQALPENAKFIFSL